MRSKPRISKGMVSKTDLYSLSHSHNTNISQYPIRPYAPHENEQCERNQKKDVAKTREDVPPSNHLMRLPSLVVISFSFSMRAGEYESDFQFYRCATKYIKDPPHGDHKRGTAHEMSS